MIIHWHAYCAFWQTIPAFICVHGLAAAKCFVCNVIGENPDAFLLTPCLCNMKSGMFEQWSHSLPGICLQYDRAVLVWWVWKNICEIWTIGEIGWEMVTGSSTEQSSDTSLLIIANSLLHTSQLAPNTTDIVTQIYQIVPEILMVWCHYITFVHWLPLCQGLSTLKVIVFSVVAHKNDVKTLRPPRYRELRNTAHIVPHLCPRCRHYDM